MNKEAKSPALMFKVSKETKDTLREEAKKQSKIRGYKVSMTALLCEWVASMRVSA